MDHQEYTSLVESKQYPEDRNVPLGSQFENDAGYILNLIESSPLNAAAVIFSKAGSERSNHLHLHSDHYLFVLSGKMEYFERLPEQDPNEIKPVMYEAGQMVYTPCGVVHMTRFPVDTVLISLGSNPRQKEQHENDLTRVKFFKE